MKRQLVVLDTFDRADNVDLGATWSPQFASGAMQIVSNAARSVIAATTGQEGNNAVLLPEQWAKSTIKTITGAIYISIGVMLRAAAPLIETYYQIIAVRNGLGGETTEIYRTVTGGITLLATESSTTWAATDTIEAEAFGASIAAYRNGVLLLVATDQTLNSGFGGALIRVEATGDVANAEIDQWEAGNLTFDNISTNRLFPMISGV